LFLESIRREFRKVGMASPRLYFALGTLRSLLNDSVKVFGKSAST